MAVESKLRFHWMLPKGGEVRIDGGQTVRDATQYRLEAAAYDAPPPDIDMKGWQHFASKAETAGIDSVLISFSRFEPDPIVLACALGTVTKRLKFIVAYRSGLMQPTLFVQQFNTLSHLINGRVSFNTVAGSVAEEQRSYGDFLAHEERYNRAEEFLSICNALWQNEDTVNFSGHYYNVLKSKVLIPFSNMEIKKPELYISGHSSAAQQLAVSQGSCWLRVIDTAEKLAPIVKKMTDQGIEVCLRLGIICRSTREESMTVIEDILEYTYDRTKSLNLPVKDDSQMFREAAVNYSKHWLNDNIWTGFVPHYGPVWTTLIGTPTELADIFLEYKGIGITQFIISGWPEINAVNIFGRDVLPLVRIKEK